MIHGRGQWGRKCLVGSFTDCKDFYHQAAITQERATSNAVGPVFKLGDFEGTTAHADFIAALAEEKRRPRSKGDFLEVPRRALLCDPGLPVHPTFKALFQGDAGGVEFATAGHENPFSNPAPPAGPRAPSEPSPRAPPRPMGWTHHRRLLQPEP